MRRRSTSRSMWACWAAMPCGQTSGSRQARSTRRAVSAATVRTGPAAGTARNVVDVAPSARHDAGRVARLILKGIPDGGMPAFPISDRRGAGDRRLLHASEAARRAPPRLRSRAGRCRRRRALLRGKGNCASCHMVRGRGGSAGAGSVEHRPRAQAGSDRAGAARSGQRRGSGRRRRRGGAAERRRIAP